MSQKLLRTALEPWGERAPEILEALTGYVELLTKHNRTSNLVGPLSRDAMFSELVLDALLPALALGPQEAFARGPMMDIGSGAGLPGVPLAALWGAQAQVHIVEPRSKRTTFVRIAARRLGLGGVQIHNKRIEQVDQALRGQIGVVAAKAFAPPLEFLEIARGWLMPGGRVFLYTSRDSWTQEEASAAEAMGFQELARRAHPTMERRAGLVLSWSGD
jgi:16S rRNA (guanine527-N7)-methyltransferase